MDHGPARVKFGTMRYALLLVVAGVLATASAQQFYASTYAHDILPGDANFRGGHKRYPSYHDYYHHHDYHDRYGHSGYHGYHGPPRRRPYVPLPYDEHRFPENHPSYAYWPNKPDNYLPNYYNFPARNPTHYEFGSYWYPSGPGPHPNTNPHDWYGYPPRKG